MTPRIHPTALIDPAAELASDVEIGPYAIVGPGVEMGNGTVIGARVTIERDTSLGRRCRVGVGAVLGSDPQDLKYRGEATRLTVGDHTTIREYATLHRGTAATGQTTVGHRCYLMAYAHVAHDCVLEDDVVLANVVQLAGHVHVEAGASIGGSTAVHQFVRIGALAFVGGASRVVQDVPPYTRAAGNPMKLYGVNAVGLERAGFDPETRRALKRAHRLLFNSRRPLTGALEEVRLELGDIPEVARLVDFVTRSQRGVLV